MPYIRLTLTAPPPERVVEVRQCYEDILAHVATFPGYVTGWVVTSGQESTEVGRLTVWDSAEAAHHAAIDHHSLALHAEVQRAAGGQVWDRSFVTDASSADELDPLLAVQTVEAWYRRPPL